MFYTDGKCTPRDTCCWAVSLKNKWINKHCWWLLPCKGFIAIPYTWGQILLSILIMAHWCSEEFHLCCCSRGIKSSPRGAPCAVLSQRKRLSTQLVWVSWFISTLVSPWAISRKRKTEMENWKKRELKLLLLYTALVVTQRVLLRGNCGRLLCFPSNILNIF